MSIKLSEQFSIAKLGLTMLSAAAFGTATFAGGAPYEPYNNHVTQTCNLAGSILTTKAHPNSLSRKLRKCNEHANQTEFLNPRTKVTINFTSLSL